MPTDPVPTDQVPSPNKVRAALRLLRRLLREYPGDRSAGYWRGLRDALAWAQGRNADLGRRLAVALSKGARPREGRRDD